MKALYLLRLSIMIATLCLLPKLALATEDDPIYKIWYKPELKTNKTPEVCRPIQDAYSAFYRGDDKINPLNNQNQSFWKPRSLAQKKLGPLTELPVDNPAYESDNNLKTTQVTIGDQVYYFYRYEFLYYRNYETYNRETFDKRPIDQWKIERGDKRQHFIDHTQGIPILNREGTQYLIPRDQLNEKMAKNYPNGNLRYVKLINLYTYNNEIYALLDFSSSKLSRGTPQFELDRYALFKIGSDLSLDLQCDLKTRPEPIQFDITIESMKNLAKLKTLLSEVYGKSEFCRRGVYSASDEPTAFLKMLNMPNALRQKWTDSKRQNEVINDELAQWGYLGIWNHQIYQEIKQVIPQAVSELSAYYQSSPKFDRSIADKLAHAAVTAYVSSSYNHMKLRDEKHEWHKALLEGPDLHTAKKKYANDNKATQIQITPNLKGEADIHYALFHPQLLRDLLAEGASVNTGNRFNKTPLMYAAQFNQLASAKILLDAGADLNAHTTERLICGETPVEGMTALHYAIRYADQAFIHTLLERGAITSSKDSKARNALDYLTEYGPQNPYLTEKSINQLAKDLTKITNDRKNKGLKINRQGEKAYSEKNYIEARNQFHLAHSLLPDNLGITSNLILSLVKLKEYTSAIHKGASITKGEDQKHQRAAIFFNMGLACQRYDATENNPSIYSNGKHYCVGRENSALELFLSSYELAPTNSRKNHILDILHQGIKTKLKTNTFIKNCSRSTYADGIQSVHFARGNIYFLTDKGYKPPYKSLSIKEKSGRLSLVYINKQDRISLGEDRDIERWHFKEHSNIEKYRFDSLNLCAHYRG